MPDYDRLEACRLKADWSKPSRHWNWWPREPQESSIFDVYVENFEILKTGFPLTLYTRPHFGWLAEGIKTIENRPWIPSKIVLFWTSLWNPKTVKFLIYTGHLETPKEESNAHSNQVFIEFQAQSHANPINVLVNIVLIESNSHPIPPKCKVRSKSEY